MDELLFTATEVVNLKYEDIPEALVKKIKLLILDQMGCQLAFADLPWGKQAYEYAKLRNGQGKAHVTYYGGTLPVEDAALCNAVFGHGFEMDDTDMPTTSHPAVAIVPAIMALANECGYTGKEVITAMVAGYEVMLRVDRCIDGMRYNFIQCTSVGGAFGAAAAAAKLMGFDVKDTAHALSIASELASGNTEYSMTGGTIKRFMGALGATAGLRAAFLVKVGITGPTGAFTGKKSYFRGAMGGVGDPDYAPLNIGFKDEWMSDMVGAKPYCCCAAQHAVIDCGKLLLDEGVTYDMIDHVEIIQRPREHINVGLITDPRSIMEAQFCGRFALALRMVKGGNGYHDYTDENLHDPDIRALMAKIDYTNDENCERLPVPEGPAIVITQLSDGRTITHQVDYALGRAQNPMTETDIIDKFRNLVVNAISPEQAEAIIQVCANFDVDDGPAKLTELLVH